MKKELSCLAALAVFLGWGCTEEDGAMRCLPGAVSTCPCVGGGAGAQTCLPSGLGLGPCECGGDGDVASDTSGDTSPDDAHDTDDADDTFDTGEFDLGGDTAGPNGGDTAGPYETDSGDETTTPDTDSTGDTDISVRCPSAVINVGQGDEVLAQTRLQLDAINSTASAGGVTAWEWSVIQPSGAQEIFRPSSFVRNPTFDANVVGVYTFKLKVFDAMGTASCSDAEYTVNVTSDDAVRVELLWRTPGDPDESDTGGTASYSAGSDVDLHFLHPNANGAYFDWTYDCYWENTNPEWGLFGPTDNPRLDRDDTDGAGPEILNIANPQQREMRFQVGVHYWDDWGYGQSFATIRIYIHGVLIDEWADVRIVDGDMWDSHYIDWPSGIVTRISDSDGGPTITPQYPVSTD